MSASEKLKALQRRLVEPLEDDARDSEVGAGYALIDALPQIVAVVEAAEDEASLHKFQADVASCPHPICVALAALDEALA